MTPFDTDTCLRSLLALEASFLPALLERTRLRALGQAVRALPPTADRVVLLNLVRGLPLVRGFVCAHSRSSAHAEHPWSGWVRALQAARVRLKADLAALLDAELLGRLDALLQDGLRYAHLHAASLAHAAGHRASTRRFVGQAMRDTPQGRVTDAWQHGRSAEQWYRFFSAWLAQGARPARHPESSWPVRLPAWFERYRARLQAAQQPLWLVQRYLLWHDCGKPWVLERDAHGALHYPEHARVSALCWRGLGEALEQDTIAELIEHDMCAHRWSEHDLQWLRDSSLGPTLLVSALAELHCNARLFGGVDSESFRIKASRLERRGRQLCEHWFEPRA